MILFTRAIIPEMSEFLQKITIRAKITVDLNVPELKNKKELNNWIKSDVARTYLIDHLKPSSFINLEIVDTSTKIKKIE